MFHNEWSTVRRKVVWFFGEKTKLGFFFSKKNGWGRLGWGPLLSFVVCAILYHNTMHMFSYVYGGHLGNNILYEMGSVW